MIACCAFTAVPSSDSSTVPRVKLKRVPEGGIQLPPALGHDGTVHLVYFKGDPSEGDLFYARSKDGVAFSDPIRVNSMAGTAGAIGKSPVHGLQSAGVVASMLLGTVPGRRAHPSQGRSPMLLTRLSDAGYSVRAGAKRFARPTGLMVEAELPPTNKVAFTLFGMPPIPGDQGEDSRRVWMARSEDDSKRLNRSAVYGTTQREPVAAARSLRLQTRRAGSTFCCAQPKK